MNYNYLSPGKFVCKVIKKSCRKTHRNRTIQHCNDTKYCQHKIYTNKYANVNMITAEVTLIFKDSYIRTNKLNMQYIANQNSDNLKNNESITEVLHANLLHQKGNINL